MNEDFMPREIANDSLRYWWILILLMVVGAAGGWVFHQYRPPVYEANSLLSVTMDYTHTGKMSELEQDRALEIVGDVISSTDVMRKVVSHAEREDIEIDEQSFKEIAYRERKSHAYLFRVRHENPQTAATLANIWTEESNQVLNQALVHAIAAEQLQSGVDALNGCLQAVVSEPVHAYCNLENLGHIQDEMLELGEMVFTEKNQSMGLFAGLTFTWIEEAMPPSSPRLYGRNLLMLSGAFIGLILAVWLIALRVPKRLISGKKRG